MAFDVTRPKYRKGRTGHQLADMGRLFGTVPVTVSVFEIAGSRWQLAEGGSAPKAAGVSASRSLDSLSPRLLARFSRLLPLATLGFFSTRLLHLSWYLSPDASPDVSAAQTGYGSRSLFGRWTTRPRVTGPLACLPWDYSLSPDRAWDWIIWRWAAKKRRISGMMAIVVAAISSV